MNDIHVDSVRLLGGGGGEGEKTFCSLDNTFIFLQSEISEIFLHLGDVKTDINF